MFSRIVPSKSTDSCGTTDTNRRNVRRSSSSMSTPSSSTRPRVGRRNPSTRLRSVDLPEPDEPDERDRLARSDLERHVVERRRDAEVVAVLDVLEPHVAGDLGHRALALVELEVGLLHDLGDGAHGLRAARDRRAAA